MAHTLSLTIITQEKEVLNTTIDQVTAPAVNGEVTILPGHIPLFTKLNDGILKIKSGQNITEFTVFDGFMDVGPSGKITILADSAARADSINLAKTMEAKKNAEEALKNKQSEIDFKQTEASLRKAILELKAAKRQKPGVGSFE
jgi:F-type H+-transporting ATPase subunit epsilon